ncbi:MAG: glutathione S-transferase C-terminal domain-containing protein [Paracoccaceae bacterium]
MGMLIDGVWCRDTNRFMKDGAFTREVSELPNPPPGVIAERLQKNTGVTLIVSPSCPWSHRTTLVRALKGLDDLSVFVTGGQRLEGYAIPGFNEVDSSEIPFHHVHQFYGATKRDYTGRATVPLLWHPETRTILSNSSATIARALDLARYDWRLAPDAQTTKIDALNSRIYSGLSNAVYRAGFATAQKAHDEAVDDVFATLDWLEVHLASRRCLIGNQITEADLFLLATLVRFDSVYASLFRCTRRRLIDYPALWAYARDLYVLPGIAETFEFEANLKGYFQNDTDTNPHGIVPDLPDVDWTKPHGRVHLGTLTVWRDGALIPFDDISGADNAE